MSARRSYGRIRSTNCGLTSSVGPGGARRGGVGHGGGARRGGAAPGEVRPARVARGSLEDLGFPAAPDLVVPAAPDPVFLVGPDPVDPVDPDLVFLACLGRPEVSLEAFHCLRTCSNLAATKLSSRLEQIGTGFSRQERRFESAGA